MFLWPAAEQLATRFAMPLCCGAAQPERSLVRVLTIGSDAPARNKDLCDGDVARSAWPKSVWGLNG